MIQNEENKIHSFYLNPVEEWDSEWIFNSDQSEKPDTWLFCGKYNESKSTLTEDWDPNHPIFEYEVEENAESSTDGEGPTNHTNQWDSDYPFNPTRYLRPGTSKFLKISNSIQNVTIDPIPPEFISDNGTEYLSLFCELNSSSIKIGDYYYSNKNRKLVFEFKDEVGLDYKQFALYKGDTAPDWGNVKNLTNDIIYYYDRTLDSALKQDYVNTIQFKSTNAGKYQVTFSFYEKWGTKNGLSYTEEDNIVNILNSSSIHLIVWDLAGNSTTFDIDITKKFKTLDTDDLNNLVPVVIKFVDIEPSNYFVEEGVVGKIITQVYDPNTELWEYKNVYGLTDISIGSIDVNSIDDNTEHSPLDGLSQFIITNITESGNIEVEAWVQTGYTEIDELIKERTYNTAICGPWIYGDEGRKYNILPYVPKYLNETEFYDFVEFFQLYINTMYKSLDTNRNISALEKIARIGNFNDIAKIEDALVYQYAKEFGSEFDVDIEQLQNVTTLNNDSYNTKDIKETYDTVKYVLEQLPIYNTFKGSEEGLLLAIKMFGFTADIVNLWVRKRVKIEREPEFHEENELSSLNDYFLTSRFDLNMPSNCTFKTFCKNMDLFIDIIKSIKPINKILNKIKYKVIIEKDISLVYDIDLLEDITTTNTGSIDFMFNDNPANAKYIENFIRLSSINHTTQKADTLCLNYGLTNDTGVTSGKCYNLINKLFKSNFKELKLRNNNLIYTFKKENLNIIINAGSVMINFKNSADKTICYQIVKNIIDNYTESPFATIVFDYAFQPGTDYVVFH